MIIKKTPQEIWEEYETGISYKQSIGNKGLYETVKQNENFFIGNQWEGVNAPDLDKPVINILKRVVAYFVSTIVSDDIGVNVEPFGGASDDEEKKMMSIISNQFDAIMENCGMTSKNRDAIRNAAVDGDACLYFYFNPDIKISNFAQGQIECEEIDNTNVHFGNPQLCDIQKQPYIIISLRKMLPSVIDEAKGNGVKDISGIVSDDDPNGVNRDQEKGKCTVLIKFWKENGTVRYMKTVANTVIKPETDLGYKRYPLAWFSWDKIKNSMHGQACLTGLIPNQIFVNKMFAMSMQHVKNMAFPKYVYNQAYFPNGFSNRVGEAIPVTGDPNMVLNTKTITADMSSQVLQMIDNVISYTRDTMGATDAALGNIKPDNTSAIIATQKASAMPLELQRMSFYQFVEDYMRIFMDMMSVNYGLREVTYTDAEGVAIKEVFDFSKLADMYLKLNIDIGASTYWSELMQVQTTDNLFEKGIITDAVTYLEAIPNGYIKNKHEIIKKLQEKEQQAQMMQEMMSQPQQDMTQGIPQEIPQQY
jgi:hypothetical protein